MKRIDYTSLKYVNNRLKELSDKYSLFRPFDDGIKLDIFEQYKDKREIILKKMFMIDDNFDNYKYVKKNFVNNESGLTTYLNQHFYYKKPYFKKQVVDFINLLSTDSDDAYFIANILSYIYDAKDFKSKKNSSKFATDEEKKELLNLPLTVLKANKLNEEYKLSALYNIMHPELCEEFLFNETHILVDLFNTQTFLHNKRNQPEFDRMYKEHLKNKSR
ncbi:hypothetical protein HDR60_01180 [bacterium]|nr:hypothetical protein [bacterium]